MPGVWPPPAFFELAQQRTEPLDVTARVIPSDRVRPEPSLWGRRRSPRETVRIWAPSLVRSEDRKTGSVAGDLVVAGGDFRAAISDLRYGDGGDDLSWRRFDLRRPYGFIRTGPYQKVGRRLDVRDVCAGLDLGPIPLVRLSAARIERAEDRTGKASGVKLGALGMTLPTLRTLPIFVGDRDALDIEPLLEALGVPEAARMSQSPLWGFSASFGIRRGEYPEIVGDAAYRISGNARPSPAITHPGPLRDDYAGDYFSNTGPTSPDNLWDSSRRLRLVVGARTEFNRTEEGDLVNRPFALGLERAGPIGPLGAIFQLRGERIQSRRDGDATRPVLFGTLIGRRRAAPWLRLYPRLDGLAQVTNGELYAWARPSYGASALLLPWLRVSGAGYLTGAVGEGAFDVDRADEGPAAAFRLDLYGEATSAGISQRFVRGRAPRNIAYLRQVIGPLEAYVRYDLRTQGVGVSFRFRYDSLLGPLRDDWQVRER